MPDPFPTFILPLLMSVGACAAFLLITGHPWARWRSKTPWARPIALSVGMLAPFERITGAFPPLLPNGATGWMFHLAIGAAIIGAMVTLIQWPRIVRLFVLTVVFAVCFSLILFNRLRDPELIQATVASIAAATIAALSWWWSLDLTGRNQSPLLAQCAMLLLALFTSAILMMSGTLTYGRLALALAGGLMGLIIFSVRSRRDIAGVAVVPALMLTVLLLAGFFFAELTWLNLVLIAIAPTCMAGAVIRGKSARNFKTTVLVLMALCIPMFIALGSALPHFIKMIQEQTEAGY
ncbi:MAG TPA: hypothetical protein VHD56_20205 [Tepidisphaeraceae bacterium]|nr:hypothetical protein [Tepidisphaeraceae bacterium]